MVPLYAVNAYFGLVMKDHTEYWDLAREAYEAVVIYSFYEFLVAYIGGSQRLVYLATLHLENASEDEGTRTYRSSSTADEQEALGLRLDVSQAEGLRYAPPRPTELAQIVTPPNVGSTSSAAPATTIGASSTSSGGTPQLQPQPHGAKRKGEYYELNPLDDTQLDEDVNESNLPRASVSQQPQEAKEVGSHIGSTSNSVLVYGQARHFPVGTYTSWSGSGAAPIIDRATIESLAQADRQLAREHPKEFHHMVPCRWICTRPVSPKEFVRITKWGTLQYVPFQLLICTLTFILTLTGDYQYGKWSFKAIYPYFAFVTNTSQIWAMYCLFWFYSAYKAQLQPCNPLWKAACIKGIVFFTFWQSVLISFLSYFYPTNCDEHPAPDSGRRECTEEDYTNEQRGRAIQDFIICIEMLLFAIAHMRVFSYKEFISRPHRDHRPLFRRVVNFFSPADVVQDVGHMVKENLKAVVPSRIALRRGTGTGSATTPAASSATSSNVEGAAASSATTTGSTTNSAEEKSLTPEETKVEIGAEAGLLDANDQEQDTLLPGENTLTTEHYAAPGGSQVAGQSDLIEE